MYDEENDATGDDMFPEDEGMGFTPAGDEFGDEKISQEDPEHEEEFEKDKN